MSISAITHPAPRRNWAFALSLIVAATLAVPPALGEAGADLPPGPKESLATWAGADSDALRALLGRTLSAEDWSAELSGVAEGGALAALADYLALNLPVAEPETGEVSAVLAALPLDGKELFVQNCLSCHGGDKYFIQQSKNVEEWMGIFDAPYHRRLLTEGVERETFASYAAATTPLAFDVIPEALQDKQD